MTLMVVGAFAYPADVLGIAAVCGIVAVEFVEEKLTQQHGTSNSLSLPSSHD